LLAHVAGPQLSGVARLEFAGADLERMRTGPHAKIERGLDASGFMLNHQVAGTTPVMRLHVMEPTEGCSVSMTHDETVTPRQRFTLASDDLPAHLDDRARLAAWQDRFVEYSCKLDISPAADRRFSLRCDLARFQEIGAIRFEGTVDRFERPSHYAAIDGSDDLIVCLNQGGSATSFAQSGRDATLRSGSVLLATNTMGGRMRAQSDNPWSSLFIPRQRIGALVANVDDLLMKPLDAGVAPVRFLGRYLDLLFVRTICRTSLRCWPISAPPSRI
jgi:hypothetical protein